VSHIQLTYFGFTLYTYHQLLWVRPLEPKLIWGTFSTGFYAGPPPKNLYKRKRKFYFEKYRNEDFESSMNIAKNLEFDMSIESTLPTKRHKFRKKTI